MRTTANLYVILFYDHLVATGGRQGSVSARENGDCFRAHCTTTQLHYCCYGSPLSIYCTRHLIWPLWRKKNSGPESWLIFRLRFISRWAFMCTLAGCIIYTHKTCAYHYLRYFCRVAFFFLCVCTHVLRVIYTRIRAHSHKNDRDIKAQRTRACAHSVQCLQQKAAQTPWGWYFRCAAMRNADVQRL